MSDHQPAETTNKRSAPSVLDKLLLTPEETAALLSVSRTRVYELMRTKKLESVRIGASRRVPAAALESFVRQLVHDAGHDTNRPTGRS